MNVHSVTKAGRQQRPPSEVDRERVFVQAAALVVLPWGLLVVARFLPLRKVPYGAAAMMVAAIAVLGLTVLGIHRAWRALRGPFRIVSLGSVLLVGIGLIGCLYAFVIFGEAWLAFNHLPSYWRVVNR